MNTENTEAKTEESAPTQASQCCDLLAFVVTADYCEASVLIFATTRSKAKSYAHGTEWLNEFEWTELKCRRAKSADQYAAKFGAGALDADTKEEQAVLRELGWYELDNGLYECRECGLHEWSGIPESTLSEFDAEEPICAGCKAQER